MRPRDHPLEILFCAFWLVAMGIAIALSYLSKRP